MSDRDVIEEIYGAFGRQDVGRILELTAPDCVVTQDDRLPWGGRFEGHDGFAQFALRLIEHVDSKVTVDAIFEADDEVIEVGRTRGTVRATGAPFDVPEVHRWTIRDGLATAVHFAVDTPTMLALLRS